MKNPKPFKVPRGMENGADHAIAQKIRSDHAETYLGGTLFRGNLSVPIHRDVLIPVCQLLKNDPALDFDYPIHITSVDYPKEPERFEVVYEFFSIRKKHQVRLKTRVPEDDCWIDSITPLWAGANFLEREVYDMMGIRFRNHPDLKRILLPDEYDEGYPLRKNFPVQGRGWRDTFDFPH